MRARPTADVAVAGAFSVAWLATAGRLPVGDTTSEVTRGRVLYTEQCAFCHGAKRKGQPRWKQPPPTGRLPAPPHDVTGHAWHHSDNVLYRVTREGLAAIVGGNYQSDMPGFGIVLSDSQIRAVFAFIRSSWPERERAFQEEMSRRKPEGGSQ
ncbi:MAG: c-type cytochrome [Pseudomonadota bacterium]|nr:c-type cytochrome [Pseudomonadota bacterium]